MKPDNHTGVTRHEAERILDDRDHNYPFTEETYPKRIPYEFDAQFIIDYPWGRTLTLLDEVDPFYHSSIMFEDMTDEMLNANVSSSSIDGDYPMPRTGITLRESLRRLESSSLRIITTYGFFNKDIVVHPCPFDKQIGSTRTRLIFSVIDAKKKNDNIRQYDKWSSEYHRRWDDVPDGIEPTKWDRVVTRIEDERYERDSLANEASRTRNQKTAQMRDITKDWNANGDLDDDYIFDDEHRRYNGWE